uniref:protein kinase family protein n=1 Tax=Lapidilactobacillus bayanensis TaxID=2485998 RepID=UPI000F7A8302|nr:protein kinase family protein [Lapidilactobacillus bayanensis]
MYYRYGSITRTDGLISGPNGKVLADNRLPFYQVPNFIHDILPENKTTNVKSKLLETYLNVSARRFSNYGGTYKAINKLNYPVIIKEARAFTGIDTLNTAINCRKREANFLQVLNETKVVPILIDSFVDWENFYLVEDYIDGMTLKKFISIHNIAFIQKQNNSNIAHEYKIIVKEIKLLLQCVQKIHDKNIRINDINTSNFIITPTRVVCIDLEDANYFNEHWLGQAETKAGLTTNSNYIYLSELGKESQKLGYIIMDMISSANYMLTQDDSGQTSINLFKEFCRQYHLPKDLFLVVSSLIDGTESSLDLLANRIPETYSSYNWKNHSKINLSFPIRSEDEFNYHIDDPITAALLRLENPKKNIINHSLDLFVRLAKNKNFINLNTQIEQTCKQESQSQTKISYSIISLYLYKITRINGFLKAANIYAQNICQDNLYESLNECLVLIDGKTASPYVDFTAGLLRILLILNDFGIQIISKTQFKKMINSIDKNFPKNWFYKNGLLGLIDSFIIFKENNVSKITICELEEKLRVLKIFINSHSSNLLDNKTQQGEEIRLVIDHFNSLKNKEVNSCQNY